MVALPPAGLRANARPGHQKGPQALFEAPAAAANASSAHSAHSAHGAFEVVFLTQRADATAIFFKDILKTRKTEVSEIAKSQTQIPLHLASTTSKQTLLCPVRHLCHHAQRMCCCGGGRSQRTAGQRISDCKVLGSACRRISCQPIVAARKIFPPRPQCARRAQDGGGETLWRTHRVRSNCLQSASVCTQLRARPSRTHSLSA